jgi:tRNA threonylcarbamoyladenosine biosynthesis protein TsaB
MIMLALDASTYIGDVAVLRSGEVLASASVAMKGAEHERFMPAVADVLRSAQIDVDAIERVVCGAGPGSFTSLRIAGAICKGIACGVGIPLFAVQSMALIVAGAEPPVGRYLSVVDALRGEAYIGLYEVGVDRAVHELEPARIVSVADVASIAAELAAQTIGPSRDLCAIVANPRAQAVAVLEDLIVDSGPVDLASWEPAYGRLAEAQVKWEAAHGRRLPTG